VPGQIRDLVLTEQRLKRNRLLLTRSLPPPHAGCPRGAPGPLPVLNLCQADGYLPPGTGLVKAIKLARGSKNTEPRAVTTGSLLGDESLQDLMFIEHFPYYSC